MRCLLVFGTTLTLTITASIASVHAAEPATLKLVTPPTERKPFEHFITRQGNKLFDGEDEFRFIGANMPGLVLPYDWTLSLPERLHLPTPWEQEDAFKTLDQMNLRVVRLWNLPIREPERASRSRGTTCRARASSTRSRSR